MSQWTGEDQRCEVIGYIDGKLKTTHRKLCNYFTHDNIMHLYRIEMSLQIKDNGKLDMDEESGEVKYKICSFLEKTDGVSTMLTEHVDLLANDAFKIENELKKNYDLEMEFLIGK